MCSYVTHDENKNDLELAVRFIAVIINHDHAKQKRQLTFHLQVNSSVLDQATLLISSVIALYIPIAQKYDRVKF